MDSVSEKVKTEFIDYNLEIDDMKTVPALLFEESSMDDSLNNEDGNKTGDEDCNLDCAVENENSSEGKLEIDLNDVNSANTCEKKDNISLNDENATDIKSDIEKKDAMNNENATDIISDVEQKDEKVEDSRLKKCESDFGLE